jgi:oligoendopeptidase F
MKSIRSHLALVLAAALLLVAANALAKERTEVQEKYTWNLTDLYASADAWQTARADVEKRIPELAKFQGHLAESPAKLFEAFEAVMAIQHDLERLGVYASMLSDQDKRVSKALEMNQRAQQMFVDFGAATAYMQPELLQAGADKIHGFVAADKRLEPYRVSIENILRWAPHTLGAAEEQILAKTGDMAGTGGTLHDVFTNSDMPYASVTLPDGQTARLDAQGYTRFRASTDRAVRLQVFKTFWSRYTEFQQTLGSMLAAQVQAHVFQKETRKFDSCMQSALFGPNVPPAVYTQLISDVHTNLPTLHRYLKLRQRMMGVDTLKYEDLYAPVVKRVDLRYTPEQAMDMTLKAVAPLGPAYVSTLQKGFESRWVDWEPTTGKRSGAYSTGVYGVHPYQLQNFTGLYDEVSTLAHESGHSMHTYLSYQNQPYVNSNYPTFVAEVASTCNEALLLDYMLRNTTDPDVKLFLLGSRLDNLRTTLFRQTLFAEFELRIHEMAEKGEALSGENMSALYLDLLRQYYGDAANVCRIDPLFAIEWAYIPHFYYNFYVYSYSTSIVASSSIANGILAETYAKKPATKARDAYLAMLSSGSSKYPIDLLKMAGVDMTTSAPFNSAISEMNRVMDQMESILAARDGKPGKKK